MAKVRVRVKVRARAMVKVRLRVKVRAMAMVRVGGAVGACESVLARGGVGHAHHGISPLSSIASGSNCRHAEIVRSASTEHALGRTGLNLVENTHVRGAAAPGSAQRRAQREARSAHRKYGTRPARQQAKAVSASPERQIAPRTQMA
eukprot:1181696-Pleurochrysis_carterae.AAC.1